MAKKNRSSKKQQAQARAERMKNLTMITVIVLFLGLGIFAVVRTFVGGAEVVRVSEDIFEYENQPVLGDPDAPVKIVEFGDYKCPACKGFKDQIYPQLKKDYIDQGKVAFYFINHAFIGEDSITAAMAAEAVFDQDPDSFWPYFEAIYDNQRNEKIEWATPELLTKLAEENAPKVDPDQLKEDIEQEAHREQLEKDREIVRKAKVKSTPTLFVNGRKVDAAEAFQYDGLKEIIEEEMAEAK
ncbi:DsbA family protein [Desmospora activa]|uniref:Protein-disulfide isomerase n=1 Tax=Desmospora activa DSM 45169 TaxID=1121389 RepID=A0A2T4ZDB1_9BACL|nr:thioredoxin domain-containing protein [Desmospora activa]PTM59881.1 protein-disulfide isomerase [Desmospora activa DSM 45169]